MKLHDDLISIVIPVYNAEKTIERAITSLTEQSYENLEIIIVNDQSTDHTLQICNMLAARDFRIRVITVEQSGPAHARNVGMECAQGRYIGFMDADDYVAPDMYQRLYVCIQTTQAKVAFCNYQAVSPEGTPLEHHTEMLKTGELSSRAIRTNLVPKMVGKKSFQSDEQLFLSTVWRGLYDLGEIRRLGVSFSSDMSYGEDLCFLLELLPQLEKLGTLEERLYFYVIGCNSLTNGKKQYDGTFLKKMLLLMSKMESLLDVFQSEELGKRLRCRKQAAVYETISQIELSDLTGGQRRNFLRQLFSEHMLMDGFAEKIPVASVQFKVLNVLIRFRSVIGIDLVYAKVRRGK